MKLNILLVLSMVTFLTSCNGQNANPSNNFKKLENQIVIGDTVNQLGNNIMVVFQDSKNVHWFGSWETGIYRYDGKTLINYTTKHGLKHNRIDEIKEDKNGNIYFNSCFPSSVITKFDGHQFIQLTTKVSLDGQQFIQLTAKTSNDWKLLDDDLWFRPAYRFDGKDLHELQFPKHPKFKNPFEIYSIFKDKKGNVWFGSNPVGVCRYNGKTFDWITENDVTELDGGPANGVRSIIQDKDGYFWFNSKYRYNVFDSTAANGDTFYERQKSIGNLDGKTDSNLNEYLSIAKDNDNNLWIATYRNGVWKYDGHNVKHYSVQENGKDIHLFYIYKDNNGDIWLGTHENGLWKLNGETFIRFKR